MGSAAISYDLIVDGFQIVNVLETILSISASTVVIVGCFYTLLTESDAGVLSIATRVRPDCRVLGVVTTFVSSDTVAVILPGLPSPGFGAHQEAPSSAAQR